MQINIKELVSELIANKIDYKNFDSVESEEVILEFLNKKGLFTEIEKALTNVKGEK